VGFIWKESSEAELLPAINAFLAAAREANQLLVESDTPWQRLRPIMNAADDKEFAALIAGYRSGVRGDWSAADMKSAEKIMDILIASGGEELVGRGTRFDPRAFHESGA
jgi:NitT/TauT family transport system substrate-binding protein